jgi:hypothetical protein
VTNPEPLLIGLPRLRHLPPDGEKNRRARELEKRLERIEREAYLSRVELANLLREAGYSPEDLENSAPDEVKQDD